MQDLEKLLSITYFHPEFENINKMKLHPAFYRLYRSLHWSEFSEPNYDNDMIILITNVINKFGFVLMARDNIMDLDGKNEPYLQVVLQYHLNNFIFYTVYNGLDRNYAKRSLSNREGGGSNRPKT